MIGTKEKATTLISAVGADDEQSPLINYNISLPESSLEINGSEQDNIREIMREMSSIDYLHTVSHSELLDTAYQPRVQVINDLPVCRNISVRRSAQGGEIFFHGAAWVSCEQRYSLMGIPLLINHAFIIQTVKGGISIVATIKILVCRVSITVGNRGNSEEK